MRVVRVALLAILIVVAFLSIKFFLVNDEFVAGEIPVDQMDDIDENIKKSVNYIKTTREYQIDLDRSLWRSNKEKVARDFFDYLNNISENYFNFTYESHVEEGYHRYSFESTPKRFGNNHLIVRERDFLIGPKAGRTTIDFKYRSRDTMEEALEDRAEPAAFVRHLSTQKVELDIHACDVRWSRGTRLFLDAPPGFEYVSDIAKYFPYVYDVDGMSGSLPLKHQSFDVYYWQLSHLNTLPNGLHFKTTITFFYDSIEEAFDGKTKPGKDGEFSFRFYANHRGYSREFNPEWEEVVERFYEKLIFSPWNVDKEMECRIKPVDNIGEDEGKEDDID